MQLTYHIQCINNKHGPNCDLNCTPVSSNKLHAACRSGITGMYHSCKYARDLVKVFDCTPCPYGLTANQTECDAPNIIPIIYENISPAFRIWTIVLGCLLGIAVIFIILLIIIFTIVQKREETSMPKRHNVRPSKTLLPWKHDEWQRSKTKATARDSGVSSRTVTSEEQIEVNYT
ncbi:unnamed protein product [Onchocerca flexuosa]|uniref:Uncharacterized protein n=1 Tax=Onchocerca flexuosa TaxID=387005 RepID=A0A3P7WY42_9BILA|nr:unnamed protein product [Onchocerca flexuosa]